MSAICKVNGLTSRSHYGRYDFFFYFVDPSPFLLVNRYPVLFYNHAFNLIGAHMTGRLWAKDELRGPSFSELLLITATEGLLAFI